MNTSTVGDGYDRVAVAKVPNPRCKQCDKAGTVDNNSPMIGETVTIDDDKLTVVIMPMRL